MTNFNLNITISKHDGTLSADVYVLTGVDPETDQRVTLGVFATRFSAIKQEEFWTTVMDYRDVNIEFQLLRLN